MRGLNDTAQVSAAAISDLAGDAFQLQIGFAEETLGFVEAETGDFLMEALAELGLYRGSQGAHGDPHAAGKFPDTGWVAKLLADGLNGQRQSHIRAGVGGG